MAVYLIRANVTLKTTRSVYDCPVGKVVCADGAADAKKKFEGSFVGGAEITNIEYTNFYKIED